MDHLTTFTEKYLHDLVYPEISIDDIKKKAMHILKALYVYLFQPIPGFGVSQIIGLLTNKYDADILDNLTTQNAKEEKI